MFNLLKDNEPKPVKQKEPEELMQTETAISTTEEPVSLADKPERQPIPTIQMYGWAVPRIRHELKQFLIARSEEQKDEGQVLYVAESEEEILEAFRTIQHKKMQVLDVVKMLTELERVTDTSEELVILKVPYLVADIVTDVLTVYADGLKNELMSMIADGWLDEGFGFKKAQLEAVLRCIEDLNKCLHPEE